MQYDIVIIGAGLLGLSTAYRIKSKKPNYKILILDKEDQITAHQSGHNSGVIHSGLYYTPGSLKAQNCIQGYHDLVEFCDQNGVEYELCGKVVVATNENQIPALDNLFERGRQNGLTGLKSLNSEEIVDYEPHVRGLKGIFVPQTGIIDYKQVGAKLSELLFELDSDISLGEKVVNIVRQKKYQSVVTNKNNYTTKMVVNCAGLYSDKIAKLNGSKIDFKIIPFRGEYYKLATEKENLVKNLIYPVPDPSFPFLGVHFTRMISGGIEAGPNAVLAFKREGYKKSDFNLSEFVETLFWPGFQKISLKYWKTGKEELHRSYSKKAFAKALQELIPEISEDDLVKGGSGVRAQACNKDGKLLDDFLILENEGSVNVCNAPSPAATSCLSIGTTVAKAVFNRYQASSYKYVTS